MVKGMKSFFMFLGIIGAVLIIVLGVALSVGIPSNSREVIKEVHIK